MCSDLRRALGSLLGRDPASTSIGEIAQFVQEIAPDWLRAIEDGLWVQTVLAFEGGDAREWRINETRRRPKRRAA